MYPSPSSSSSQSSMDTTGLIRFGSAPGSLLTTAVDSVIGANREFSTLGSQTLIGQYFSSDSSSLTSESSCKVNAPPDPNGPKGLQRSLGLNEIDVGDFTTASNLKVDGSSSLIRHSSSPAGFLNHLIADNGFSVTRGIGSYNNSPEGLKSQLSFTRQDSVSQISEVSKNGVEGMSSNNNGHRKVAHSHSYATANSFRMGSWDDTNAIVFSDPQNKRPKNMDHLLNGFNSIETQLSLPQTALEMATMEELLQIHQDSVPCKTRAKRGCATHPRSIAERERRTRISGKLKKLQELVPNMDKQTSYADMLELAVQHIKGLQNQVQMLNKDLESCTCGCRQTT